MQVGRTLGGVVRLGERRVPVARTIVGHLALGIVALLVASGTFAAEFDTVVAAVRGLYVLSGTAVVFGWLLVWLGSWLLLEVVWSATIADRNGR